MCVSGCGDFAATERSSGVREPRRRSGRRGSTVSRGRCGGMRP
jgi:hypothetical protein